MANDFTFWSNESQPYEISRSDIQEYKNEFNFAKKALLKNWNDEYQLYYFRELDYVVPVAFQDSVRPYCDFNNNIINDITDIYSKVYEINICIFPMIENSVVFMFGYGNNYSKRYRRFLKQFNKLSQDDKLATMCYLPFRYSEDVFIYKNINKNVLDNKSLALISGMHDTCEYSSNTSHSEILSIMLEAHSLSKRFEIPNLLLKEYAVNVNQNI